MRLLGQVRSEKSRVNGTNGRYLFEGVESMMHLFNEIHTATKDYQRAEKLRDQVAIINK